MNAVNRYFTLLTREGSPVQRGRSKDNKLIFWLKMVIE